MSDQRSRRNAGSKSRRSTYRYARPRFCQFCTDSTIKIDYKKIDLLRRFVAENGKIRPRRQTGTCSRHQRKLARAIKRARHLALLPFTGETLR